MTWRVRRRGGREGGGAGADLILVLGAGGAEGGGGSVRSFHLGPPLVHRRLGRRHQQGVLRPPQPHLPLTPRADGRPSARIKLPTPSYAKAQWAQALDVMT